MFLGGAGNAFCHGCGRLFQFCVLFCCFCQIPTKIDGDMDGNSDIIDGFSIFFFGGGRTVEILRKVRQQTPLVKGLEASLVPLPL